jgi:isoleucyl-tRNA synthetase
LQPSNEPTGEAVETFEVGDERLTIGVRRVEADEALNA